MFSPTLGNVRWGSPSSKMMSHKTKTLREVTSCTLKLPRPPVYPNKRDSTAHGSSFEPPVTCAPCTVRILAQHLAPKMRRCEMSCHLPVNDSSGIFPG